MSCIRISCFCFFQVASELWPDTAVAEASDEEGHDDSDDGAVGDEVAEDFEKQVAKELATIMRPRKEQRFGMSPFTLSVRTGPDIRVDRLIT